MLKILRRALLLLALLAAAYAGFRWGGAFFPRLERAVGLASSEAAAPAEAPPTAELADSTLDRFEAFRAGRSGERLALGGRALTSLVRFAVPGLVPPGVSEPQVRLADGRVHLEARVEVAAFPRLPKLDEVVGILPDTVTVALRGTLVPHDQRNLALMVDRVSAAGIPVPSRMVGEVLEGFGRGGRAGLPPDALPVPLPDGVGSARVLGDSLVLLAPGGGLEG